MNKKVGQIILVLVLVVLIGVLFFMRGNDDAPDLAEPGAGAPELVIISPHADHIQQEFDRAFQKWHSEKHETGVKIEWRDIGGGTQTILSFIEDQYRKSPEGIKIDILWGGGVDPHIRLMNGNYLEPVEIDQALLAGLQRDMSGIALYDKQFRWYGVCLSGFGILYNKTLLVRHGLPEPKTWEALADPKAFQLVASGDPRRSGSNHACYEIMLQAYGWERGFEIITKMVGNLKTLSEGSSGAIQEVELGNCAYALAIDFYAWGKIREIGSGTIGYVIPKGLSVINPDAISVLKGAPNVVIARRFIEFVMSPEGQKLWMLPAGVEGGPAEKTLARMAIRPDLYGELGEKAVISVNPFDQKTGLVYDAKKGALRSDALNVLIGRTLLDPMPELREAWQAVIKRGLKPEEVALLTKPPVSEEQLLELAKEWKRHPEKKTRTAAEWEAWARAKYERLSGQ